MTKSNTLAMLLGIAALCPAGLFGQDKKPAPGPVVYQNDFSKVEAGKVPEDMLVLEGAFAVAEEGGNKFLELPGAPLETFGVLFGPAQGSGLSVTARIFGTGKGRRGPRFGVGLGGVGGHRVLVEPGKKSIVLFKGDEQLLSKAYAWESGTWTKVRLQIRKAAEGTWKVEAKAWKDGAPEPAEWLLSYDEKTEPNNARAAIWGSPFSGTPVRFDDLQLTKVP